MTDQERITELEGSLRDARQMNEFWAKKCEQLVEQNTRIIDLLLQAKNTYQPLMKPIETKDSGFYVDGSGEWAKR